MKNTESLFTLYTRHLPDRDALGILLTRGGSERFELLPLKGRTEDDVFLQEVPDLLLRRLGAASGQTLRLPGESMMALTALDLGYQLRPMGDSELDWHGSLFEDWSSRPEVKKVPAPVSPPVSSPEKPSSQAPAEVNAPRPSELPPRPESLEESVAQVSKPDARPSQDRTCAHSAADIEALRALLRELFKGGNSREVAPEVDVSDLRREIAGISMTASQTSTGLEAIKARIDLINQRLLAIERDKVDFSRRFDDIDKRLGEVAGHILALQPPKRPRFWVSMAQAILSTLLVALLCLSTFFFGILLGDGAGSFLRGGKYIPDIFERNLKDPAHSGADWAKVQGEDGGDAAAGSRID